MTKRDRGGRGSGKRNGEGERKQGERDGAGETGNKEIEREEGRAEDRVGQKMEGREMARQVTWPRPTPISMDTLGIEPRASRMLSGCDTTTPRALCKDALCFLSKQIIMRAERFELPTFYI